MLRVTGHQSREQTVSQAFTNKHFVTLSESYRPSLSSDVLVMFWYQRQHWEVWKERWLSVMVDSQEGKFTYT